jgi:uncharacterized protein YegP (UPF0339 family)
METTTPTSEPTARSPYVEIAQDAEGWHWVLWSGNGRMICRNAVAYQTKKHCLQAIEVLKANVAGVKNVVVAHEK